jgi:hypothetical protein
LRQEIAETMDACEELRETLLAALGHYEPEVLGLYEYRGNQRVATAAACCAIYLSKTLT